MNRIAQMERQRRGEIFTETAARLGVADAIAEKDFWVCWVLQQLFTIDTIRSLSLGRNSLTNLTLIAISRRAEVDTDGLVPTSLFHSIFISHEGKFVILNPSFPKIRS